MKDTIFSLLVARFGAVPERGVARGTDFLSPKGDPVLLKTACSAEERAALAREVDATLRLSSAAFRRVRAVAHDEAKSVAVFEHVEGLSLTERLRAAPEEALSWTIALLRVLRSMHDAGIAHGDLKPEHVLIDTQHALRFIDLGLATPLGAIARGGTHGFLAPELLEAAPVSVASDLFAFGATLRDAAGASASSWPSALRALVGSCIELDPQKRPSSAGAALAALDATEARADHGGVRVDQEALSMCRNSGLIVISAPPRSGRTTLVRALLEERLGRGYTTLDLKGARAFDPLLVLADRIGIPKDREPVRRAAIAVARIAALGVPIVIDDADELDEDGVESVLCAARTITASIDGQGTLIVIGASASLTASLVENSGLTTSISPLEREQARGLFEAHGARADEETIQIAMDATEGRAAELALIARVLATQPLLSVRDAIQIQRAERQSEPCEPQSPEPPIERARRELARGAPRAAVRALREAPSLDLDARILLARAEAAAGRLDEADRILGALGGEATADASLEYAIILERRGRHADAVIAARRAMAGGDPSIAAHAAVVLATSTLALGDPEATDRIACEGLSLVSHVAIRARLEALRSDAALRAGDAERALERANEAERSARASGDPATLAHALARAAAAFSLCGQPSRARERWADALREAERAGDIAALPPYLMNLATAEHALGEIESAMARYERAAELAGRLGRLASRAAALTNLGGLLALVGAEEEAVRVLQNARGAAEHAEVAVYVAQTQLIAAEILARHDPVRAEAEAAEARRAFEACGAQRQVLETSLLEAEIALARGDASGAREAARRASGRFREAGLAARAGLLTARACMALDAPDEAFRAAEQATTDARAIGDRDLEARALMVLAEAHEKLGTGAGENIRARAREAIGELAARIPPGLRERFLAARERAKLVQVNERGVKSTGAEERLGSDAWRLLALLRRVLLEPDEQRVLELALDEAVALTRAERAFLLRRREGKRPHVAAARNLDRESIRQSRFRFSRSVAERVLESGEPLVTASASDDPALKSSRSVLHLGLRSILCVPVRAPTGIIGALYIDHRFETGRFDVGDRDILQALADIVGIALENARLHREANRRELDLSRAHESLRLENARKDAELERLTGALARGETFAPNEDGIIGRSRALRDALEVARRIAPSELPVLIEGESGSGKEVFARFIHARSRRATAPFVAINCGALPEALIESELFGHVRGAFTGALRDHPGTFRTAHGGTLLLDEIGELPLRMQTRLLRVLQEREVRPVGADASVAIDVRVIAATNRDLESEVEAERFRRDLFFRLNGVRLRLPPLRERREDVPALATAALEKIAAEPGMRQLTLSRKAIAALVAHDWPGNVRELEQALRRAVAIADGDELGSEHFELGGLRPMPREAQHLALDRALIEQALRTAGGNRTVAAQALGISRVTLHRWIARLGIELPTRPGRPRTSRTS